MLFTDLKPSSFPCSLLPGALRVRIMHCVIKNCSNDLCMNNLETELIYLFVYLFIIPESPEIFEDLAVKLC